MTNFIHCFHGFMCRANCMMASFTSFINLFVRIYMANIFFKSGLVKVSSWASTLYLFEFEYKVPILPYTVAAIMATFVELVGSTALVLGFATRFSALALLFMTLVMNYTYQENPENYYWMLIFAMLVAQGGKKLSIDNTLRKRYCGINCNCPCCTKTCSHGKCCPTEKKEITLSKSKKATKTKKAKS